MATKKTDTIAGKRILLGNVHSVTIEAVRGRKVTIVAQAPDDEHIRIVSASEEPGQQASSEFTLHFYEPK